MTENFQDTARKLLDFIDRSPTCFHAVDNLKQMLEADGFRELPETSDWREEPYFAARRNGQADAAEGKFYVVRNGSALLAFRIPGIVRQDAAGDTGSGARVSERLPGSRIPWKGFHIVASHCDSPCFKVKEQPEMTVENRYVRLNTEKYGGMLYSSWLDRPLSIAGRLAVRTEDGIEARLVKLEDILVIPSLATHLNREANKGVEYNPQVDLLPLFGSAGEKMRTLSAKAAEAAGVKEEDILSHDLFLYVKEQGRIFGADGEFVLSPRLDDLQCVYASASAFLESSPKDYINICAVFDNEEVGSGTKQGADSTFLEEALSRLTEAFGETPGTCSRLVAGGFLISADNAHAVHPNHPEKSDPTNRPYLNGGVVIKYQGSQRYATDALSGARMKRLCEKAGVPCQTYANRSDIIGGSTLGNISASHVSIPAVDIGLPQLAMHSAVETAGVMDTEYAVRALKAFWEE